MADREAIDGRPDIVVIKTGRELKRWYWRKAELMDFARLCRVKTSGAKFDLLERLAHYLDTGAATFPGDRIKKPNSGFDWHSEPLGDTTVLTDSYKNTQNVRRYFKATIGPQFKFNIAFMEWLKANHGKTLADACDAYRALQQVAAAPGFRTQIKEHNQFNQFTRDLLDANPHLTMADVRRIWARKIALPSETGRHRYCADDLKLLNE